MNWSLGDVRVDEEPRRLTGDSVEGDNDEDGGGGDDNDDDDYYYYNDDDYYYYYYYYYHYYYDGVQTTPPPIASSTSSTSEQRMSVAELVEGVEEVENAQMMKMLKKHGSITSGMGMGDVLWTLDWESEVGTSTCAMLRKPVTTMARPRGSVMLPVANGSVTLSIPRAVVAQVPAQEVPHAEEVGAIVLATRFVEEAVALFSDLQSTLIEPPLSLRILGADRVNYLEGVRLAEPIVIKLQEVKTPGVVCAYLDEETGAWRRDGVVEVRVDGDDGLYCQTSHLTIFAPILQKVEFLVSCSQAHLMSESGLRSISRSRWYAMPATVFFWLMLLLQGALCILAVQWDRKATDEESWKDAMLLTENAAYKRADSLVESSVQQVESILEKDFLTRFCTYRALSYSMRVTACDVEQIVRGSRRSAASDASPAFHHLPEKSPSTNPSISTCPSTGVSRASIKSAWEVDSEQSEESSGGSLAQTPSRTSPTSAESGQELEICDEAVINVEVGSEPSKESCGGSLAEVPNTTNHTSAESRLALKICDEAVSIVEAFWRRSFWQRTWIIFSAEHPWIQTNYFSITRAAATRALLLSAQVMGSMMLSAAFFINMGDAFSKESPGECQPESLLGRLQWNVTIGAISSLFCYLPLYIITSVLCARQFVYKEQWDDEEKKRLLRSWRMRDVALWFVVVLYVVWSVLFTVLFLANVSFKSGLHWTVASLANFIRDFFLLPLAISGLVNALATLVHRFRPSSVKRVCKEFNFLRGGRHAARRSCYVYEEEPSSIAVAADSWAKKGSEPLSGIVPFGCGSSSLQILSWTVSESWRSRGSAQRAPRLSALGLEQF